MSDKRPMSLRKALLYGVLAVLLVVVVCTVAAWLERLSVRQSPPLPRPVPVVAVMLQAPSSYVGTWLVDLDPA